MDNFEGVLFPTVVRAFAKTISLDLVPVQPMQDPFVAKRERVRKERIKKIKNILNE